jgi:hypothetical protein
MGKIQVFFIVKAGDTCSFQWALNGWLGRDADHSPPSSAQVENE